MAGPFYSALVDPIETTFGVEHQREDLKIFTFNIEQTEGDFCGLTVETLNPREGLLAPGRKTSFWFGWDSGSSAGVIPLFFGRITGFPTGLFGEVIQIEFTAKPQDFVALKAALAETLKILPNYDPIFIDEAERSNPDNVLEGYSKIWHIDRVTHEITVSDIISGEDGTEEFSADEVAYDSVDMTLENPPFTSVSVEMAVNWNQTVPVAIDIGSRNFLSYTGDGLISDWPKPGASLSGGWRAVASTAIDVWGVGAAVTNSWSYNWTNREKTHESGDDLSVSDSETQPLLIGPYLSTVLTDRMQIGLTDPFADPPINRPATRQTQTLFVPKWNVATTLSIAADAAFKRAEIVKFTLNSDLQQIIIDAGETQVSELKTINGGDVGVAIPDDSSAGSSIPIGDAQRRSFFPTDRGIDCIKYGLLVARAMLRKSARSAGLSWDVSFERALDLNCRKNAGLEDDRIPGGHASGKIVSYQIMGNGDQAKFDGGVTIGCAIGMGNSVTADPGEDDYIDDDYIEDYYERLGEILLASGEGDVGFSIPVDSPDGEIFPMARADAVVSESVTGSIAAQEIAILAAFEAEKLIANLSSTPALTEQIAIDTQKLIAAASVNSLANALKNNPISYNLELVNLSGKSFATEYDLTVTELTVPQQIDLAAEAASA